MLSSQERRHADWARHLLLLGGLLALMREAVCQDLRERVEAAGVRCMAEVEGGASGPAFVGCIDREVDVGHHNRQYFEFIRNFSCAQDDLGTPPERRTVVTVPVGYDACEAAAAVPSKPGGGGDVQSPHQDFDYLPGVLPAGNDIVQEADMDVQQAAQRCTELADCKGFTYQSKSPFESKATMFFKSSAYGYRPDPKWHTMLRKKDETCTVRDPGVVEEMRSFHVDIIREEPLVAMVRGFATAAECDELVAAGGAWEGMSRAYTSSGGFSQERRSYSSNIYPPLNDPQDGITRLTALMFAVTRNLTGYVVYPQGQEPVNAVLYKIIGDEYRPHCDGDCAGSEHQPGERIATSILYCRAAEKGGQTSFTESALKVVPAEGDMLLFAYRYPDGKMTRAEAEHSGCPLRAGKKWIATQWYREGVSELWNWEAANQQSRF